MTAHHSKCFHIFFHHEETLQCVPILKYFSKNPMHNNDLLDKINGEILLSHLVCTACLVLQHMLLFFICSLYFKEKLCIFTNCLLLCLADHLFCLLMIGRIRWILCIAIKRASSTIGAIIYAGALKSCLHSMSFQLSIMSQVIKIYDRIKHRL